MRELFIKTCLAIVPQIMSHKLAGEFVPVFMLHRISDSNGDPDLAKIKQLHTYLAYVRKHNYHPITLEALMTGIVKGEPLPKKCVAFTVDDGFADQFELLAPIFSQYDIPLTCFVITGLLDGILWPWDDQVKYIITTTKIKSFSVNLPDGEQFCYNLDQIRDAVSIDSLRFKLKNQDQTHLYDWLHNLYNVAEVEIPIQPPIQYRAGSWEQANAAVRSGHSIAAHTKTHRILSRLNDTEASEEIIGSYQHLKSRVPESEDIFAYPTG